MATGNMLLGYARGKVGSLVFTRRNGQQVTRPRNFNPANPRTLAQMSQRMKMYAPVALYKATLGKNFKYAFQDQRANETAFNAFIRKNISNAPWVNKSLASQLAPIPFPALVSDGSLQSLDTYVGAAGALIGGDQPEVVAWHTAVMGLSLDQGTIAEASSELLEKYPTMQEGDMLTFVCINAQGLSVERGDVLFNGVDTLQCRTAQFVVDTTSSALLSTVGLKLLWTENGLTGAPSGFGLTGGDGVFDQDGIVSAGAIIVTRRDGSKVSASTERLQLNEFATQVYNLMSTNAYREAAAQSYKTEGSPLLDPTSNEQ